MRKMKLAVENLEVTSFTTEEQSGARGTVGGHLNEEVVSGPYSCEGFVNSCAVSCFTCGSCDCGIGSRVTFCFCDPD